MELLARFGFKCSICSCWLNHRSLETYYQLLVGHQAMWLLRYAQHWFYLQFQYTAESNSIISLCLDLPWPVGRQTVECFDTEAPKLRKTSLAMNQ